MWLILRPFPQGAIPPVLIPVHHPHFYPLPPTIAGQHHPAGSARPPLPQPKRLRSQIHGAGEHTLSTSHTFHTSVLTTPSTPTR